MLLGTQLVDLRRIERRYSVIRLADLHQIETSSDTNKIYFLTDLLSVLFIGTVKLMEVQNEK